MADPTNPLNGKVALVTGASSGIGAASALALADAGADVVLGARRTDELEKIAESIRAKGRKAIVKKTDVTDLAQIEALFAAAEDELGGVDIVFNNAGVEGQLYPITEEPEDNYDFVFNVNVKGAWSTMRTAATFLKRRGGGRDHQQLVCRW